MSSTSSTQSQTVSELTMSERQFSEIWTAAVQQYRAENKRPIPPGFADIRTLIDLLVRLDQRRDKLSKHTDKKRLSRSVKKVLHASFDFMKQVAATQPPFGAILGVREDLHTTGDENEIPNMFDALKRFLNRLSPRLDTVIKPALRNYLKDIFVILLVFIDDIKGKTSITFPKRLRNTLAKLKQLLEEESSILNVEILEQQENIKDLLRHTDPILRWLSAPDVSTSHDDAVNKRHGNSGEWFISGDDYNRWKTEENSFMWIHGMTGSGKTVLCASIIDDIGRGNNDLAYFYFDTNRQEQNSFIQMLTSLVSSLYNVCEDRSCFRDVDWNHRPKPFFLREVLRNMLQSSNRAVYLVIDALDECHEADLDDALRFIVTIKQLNCSNCHMLITSREKDEIKISFQEISPVVNVDLSSMANHIKEDIKSYIAHELQCDKQLQRWGDEGKALILKELTGQADGMFRLVACQLSGLKKCFSSMQGLKEALASLPKTLQDSYQRTLDGIPEMNRPTIDKFLMWLACSFSPLTLPELATVVAFDDVTYKPNDELELHHAQDITRFCSDLVQVTSDGKVILAHASVKAFLLSHHFKARGGTKLCHEHVAKICIQSAISGFKQLENYAKFYWASHIIQGELMDDDVIVEMSKPLFVDMHEKFACYHFLQNNDYYYYFKPIDGQPSSPLVYASLLGMSTTVDWLLNLRDLSHDFGLALLAASYQGHGKIIKSLLERGARVDVAHGFDNMTALQFGSLKPHLEVVWLFIKEGADVNQKGAQGGTVLHTLALSGHDDLVKELLNETDITVDAVDDLGCTPFHRAATRGCLGVMVALLDKGANINQHGTKGTALHLACFFGHIDVIKFLLDHNAQVDTRNAATGTPLHAACFNGHLDAVELLLENGADVNLPGGQTGTALRAALYNGHINISTCLIQHGAMINMEDPSAFQDLVAILQKHGLGTPTVDEYGEIQDLDLYLAEKDVADELLGKLGIELTEYTFESGVKEAARSGNMELLKHFLQLRDRYKPDIDVIPPLGWALCDASAYGQLDAMNFLLEHYKFDRLPKGMALIDAILGGQNEAIDLLFEKVAFNSKTLTESCLHIAAYKGNEKVIRALLNRGADVNRLIMNDRSALDDALVSGQPKAARMLIEECGADIHGKGKRAGEPIGVAAEKGYLDIIELMMKKSISKEEFVIALGRACCGEQTDVVLHLLGYEYRLKELVQDDLQIMMNMAGGKRNHEATLIAEKKIKEYMTQAEDGLERDQSSEEVRARQE